MRVLTVSRKRCQRHRRTWIYARYYQPVCFSSLRLSYEHLYRNTGKLWQSITPNILSIFHSSVLVTFERLRFLRYEAGFFCGSIFVMNAVKQFHASVLLLIMNFFTTLSKNLWISEWIRKLMRRSIVKTGHTHEKLASISFLRQPNRQIVRSRSLTHRITNKFMCRSVYWRWKLANKRENFCSYRISILYWHRHNEIVKLQDLQA